MNATLSVIAHYFIGLGLAFSLTQGLRLRKWLVFALVSGLGAVWEYGLQRVSALMFTWWDPQPDPSQVLEWAAGAASGLLLVWVLERRGRNV